MPLSITVPAGAVQVETTLEIGVLTAFLTSRLSWGPFPDYSLGGAISVSPADGSALSFSSSPSGRASQRDRCDRRGPVVRAKCSTWTGHRLPRSFRQGSAIWVSIDFSVPTTGTFVVLQAWVPLGLVSGVVSATAGAPVAGGIVASTLSPPFIGVTANDGSFTLRRPVPLVANLRYLRDLRPRLPML